MKESIWIFNHYAVTPDMPGGTRHYDLGKELVRRGHNVTIFASSFHHSTRKEMKTYKKERFKVEDFDGVKFVWIKTFPYQDNNWRRAINMIFYMIWAYIAGRNISKTGDQPPNPDVIVGSSVHLLAVLAAYCLAKHYNSKLIMEVRDLWPQTLVDMGKFHRQNPVVKLMSILERFLYKRVERIIVVPPQAREYISNLGIDKSKIIWIPNGVDLSRYRNVVVAPSKTPRPFFTAIYAGTLGLLNRLDILLDAAKIIQERGDNLIRILLVGDGPKKSELVNWTNQSGLRNVDFQDPVSKAEVPKILNQADVCVLDTDLLVPQYGLSPNKMFDYMAAGKPIIFQLASPDPSLVDFGLFVPSENPDLLAEAIIQMSEMPREKRLQMGIAARKYVEQNYSIPTLVDRLENILREL